MLDAQASITLLREDTADDPELSEAIQAIQAMQMNTFAVRKHALFLEQGQLDKLMQNNTELEKICNQHGNKPETKKPSKEKKRKPTPAAPDTNAPEPKTSTPSSSPR